MPGRTVSSGERVGAGQHRDGPQLLVAHLVPGGQVLGRIGVQLGQGTRPHRRAVTV